MPDADPGSPALALFAWLSPGFPIGGFAYSHGLEAAVEFQQVTDAASLEAWIGDLLEHGSAGNDAILASAAWRAAASDDAIALAEANDLALALCASRERRLECSAQGNAFAATIRAAWPLSACPHWCASDIAYPVAFGSACAMTGFDRRLSLEAFALAFVQSLVSAALRLGIIGQTEGQRVTAALVGPARRTAAAALDASLDDVGGCAQRSDIAALRHETLYSRLFRS